MKPVLILILALIVLVSGCTTGNVVEKDVSPVLLPPQEQEPVEKEVKEIEETVPEDPCETLVCEDSEITCPDNFVASCENSCSGGACDSCTPSCEGHELCQEEWSCTSWSACESGEQTRPCQDSNECGTSQAKPQETRSCEQTNLEFSEVLYDTPGKDSIEEWVEIYNPSSQAVQLEGWKIKDNSGSWTFPESSIPASSYIVIARNSEGFSSLYSCTPDLEGFSRPLNNDGDQLTLLDPDGKETDFVAWESGASEKYPDWVLEAAEGKTISYSQGEWLGNQEPDPDC